MTSAPLLFAAVFSVGFSSVLPHDVSLPRITHAAALPEASTSPVAHALGTSSSAINDSAVLISAEPSRGENYADAALNELRKHVRRQSHPDALRLAFQAYYNFQAAHPGRVRKPYLYFVDYGLDSNTPRGYVFDMKALRLVEGPFTVAHGRGSSSGASGVPTKFSNTKDSAASSLGLYLAQETYAFSGKSGGRRYHSIGLRLQGLSGQFNSAARARGIVVHGAPYVTPQRAGRSEGCPAMEETRAQRLIPKISNGGLVFLFSPKDPSWVGGDPWFRAAAER